MNFIIYFVLTIVAFIVVIAGIFWIIKQKLNHVMGKDAVNELIQTAKMAKDLEREEYARPKEVGGLTKLLEPSILKDFPDFHKELLFQKVEDGLSAIWDALEHQNIEPVQRNKDLVLLQDTIQTRVKDMKERGVKLAYGGVRFHQHAMKSYEKKNGMATITTTSAVEYFYENSESPKAYSNLKKQTRYTCRWIYVFDDSKIKQDTSVITIHCPNCGAPLHGLGKMKCTYCGSDVEPVNLKAWKMVEYQEDYGE